MNSHDSNKLVVRRLIEEVFNTGDISAVEKFIAPDYVDHNAGPDDAQGVEGYRQHIRAVRHTYPDFHVRIEFQIAEGDLVVTRVVGEGTHQNEWLGLTPSGSRVSMTGINIDRVVDGKIVEHWGEANTISAIFQMGGKITQAEPA